MTPKYIRKICCVFFKKKVHANRNSEANEWALSGD